MADFDADPWAGADLAAVLAVADARAAARAASGAAAGVARPPALAAHSRSVPPLPPPPPRPAAQAPPRSALATGVFADEAPVVGVRPQPAFGAPGPPVFDAGPSFQHAPPVPPRPAPPPAPAPPFRASAAAAAAPSVLAARFLVSPPADPAAPSPAPCVDVQVAGFHPAIGPALEALGGVWVAPARAWRLPAARAADAARALASATASTGVRLHLEPLPDIALRLLAAAAALPDDSALYASLPPRLEAALMPFQREGVRFGLRHGGRVLIGDEMGLGKTVQAIALMAAYRSEWPALIICPSSLREAWAAALTEWLGARADRVVVVNTAKEGAGIGAAPAPTYDFVIISYSLVGKLKESLARARFRVVTLDESHYIKDGRAARTKDTVPLASSAARCILLSGTPALARPKELFSQLGALLPAAGLRALREFGERYCQATGRGRTFGLYEGASNLDELNRVLNAAVMVRRLKADVLKQLPPKRRQQVFLEVGGPEKKELACLAAGLDATRVAFARASAAAAAGGAGDAAAVLRGEERRAVMDAYHKTALLKRAAVQRHVEDLLAAGTDKFLIFAHHTDMLDAISFTLTRAKVSFMRIDGGVAAGKRQGLVDEFQTTRDMRAAVLSISAAGVGLTLTGASIVIFAELSWTPGLVIQAEDRAHRIGQASAVNVYFLLLRGSADDIIWATLQSKLEAVGGALDGRRAVLGVAAPAVLPGTGQATLPGMLARGGGSGGGGGGGARADPASPPTAAAPGPYDEDDGMSSPVHGATGKDEEPPIVQPSDHLPRPPPFARQPASGPMDRFLSPTQGGAGSGGRGEENATPPGGGAPKRARVVE